MAEAKKTICSIFYVPLLQIPREALKNNGFINGFERDVDNDSFYEDSVFLLFKPTNIDRFREFLDDEYERTKSIIDDYNHPTKGYVVVVYKLNEEFKEDYKLIKQGRYSKTSQEFQKLFPRVVKIMVNGLHRDEISLQYRIFNRTQDLISFWEEKFGMTFNKDQEVWSGYNEENETLSINKINEYV